uniref:K Homology domain-containing protein n=1 Tax=Ditylenchus dipsaci TaxID=166011 RepID=A0A915CYI2_9BILA
MQKKYVSHRYMINPMFVPKVIGISGVAIKKIQQESGARVAFEGLNSSEYPNGRVLRIKALELRPFEIARQMVEEICGRENMQLLDAPDDQSTVSSEFSIPSSHSDMPSGSNSGIVSGSNSPNETANIMKLLLIPSSALSEVVGQGNINLKELEAAYTLTSVELLKCCTTPSGEKFSPVCLNGPEDKVKEAKSLLEQIVMEIQQKQAITSKSRCDAATAMEPSASVNEIDEQLEDDFENIGSSPSKSAFSSTIYSPRGFKRARDVQDNEDDDEIAVKMRRKELDLLDQQIDYFKKRCIVAELQMEQLKMDNYWRRTELELPACLTTNYNGDKVELRNRFAEQETSHGLKKSTSICLRTPATRKSSTHQSLRRKKCSNLTTFCDYFPLLASLWLMF